MYIKAEESARISTVFATAFIYLFFCNFHMRVSVQIPIKCTMRYQERTCVLERAAFPVLNREGSVPAPVMPSSQNLFREVFLVPVFPHAPGRPSRSPHSIHLAWTTQLAKNRASLRALSKRLAARSQCSNLQGCKNERV